MDISKFLLILSLTLGTLASVPPPPPPCGGYYDCNYYFDYFTSVSSISDCKAKCKSSCRCGHYSFNFNTSGLFSGHCYLSYSCEDPLPSIGEWVSGPKVCKEHMVGEENTYYYYPYADRGEK
eukprot:TRINITY_DN80436_c0_g1_i1.p1 TRINITY_DN80436_c0_g1~~TRINITY_DN80436_c0_g1_i1.p1  ORF type:complete len:137 (+),score=33.23 TRINITY_DN80436_c0_g1_i1:47-412(+)